MRGTKQKVNHSLRPVRTAAPHGEMGGEGGEGRDVPSFGDSRAKVTTVLTLYGDVFVAFEEG